MERPKLFCDSCGMRMEDPEDHGGRDIYNPYCKHCCDVNGNLKPRNEVRAGMVKFYMEKYDYPKQAAERFVDNFMSKMPAWKDR